MDNITSAYMSIYLDELEEQLQILDQMLLELERVSEQNALPVLQTIFRAAHTLKGSSAVMGFEQIKDLTHKVESVFDLLRNNRLALDVNLVNVLFRCVDYLKVQRELFLQGVHVEKPIYELLELLEPYMSPSENVAMKSKENETGMNAPLQAGDLLIELFEDQDIPSFLTGLKENEKLSIVNFSMKADIEMPAARALLLVEQLKMKGNFHDFRPSISEMLSEQWQPCPIYGLFSTSENMESYIQELKVSSYLNHISIVPVKPESLTESKKLILPEVFVPATENNEAAEISGKENKGNISQTVRVDVSRLEHLINLVGELIIDQTRLHEVGRQLRSRFKGENEIGSLEDITNHLGRVIGELQEGMMKTRMLPIEQLFNRFPRLIRDLAQQAGKEIELTIEGKETELDRTLIEEISDPLIHMLRNAADHGLEPPEERARIGKPTKGQIVLKATHQENAIVLTIADDGRGIDPERNKRKAIEKGFLTEEEANRLSRKELISLIFRSGMSTAERVTDLSGRGVGMDIVRAHIEKLNGIIDIDTTLGQGTIFTIKLPLTLAIIRSLLVEVDSRTYALPLVNVIEISRLHEEDIKTLQGREVCMVRGDIVPLVRLNHILRVSSQEPRESHEKSRMFIVIVGMAEKRVCLLVDHPIGNQEIVIKTLGNYVGHVPFIAGSTILGDGGIALILDVGSIIRNSGSARTLGDGKQPGSKVVKDLKLVTFALDSETYALDIHKVKEIITPTQLTQMVSSDPFLLGIINLRGALLPVYDLRLSLGMAMQAQSPENRIMIIEVGNKDVGFWVDRVTQVLTIGEDAIEPVPEGMEGRLRQAVNGICKANNQLITLLDVERLLPQESENQEQKAGF
ncbi:chemotaxis protein CheA [Paenibacillus baekrokdamisoli]|uniref:Chemotaxis protein CheA n=1 Tax=Paenibacillus baekrokdamisoli TaxID=1712516 RepID=A0A3G9J206_9BACL|nr:chemotaxis protein CheW [Paenibacillus baekrokdamisoli]MBB3071372.1 two-component system chemotaxis sensor kinase CheA [Paenibacillus baekrokdamisoli]BBH24592.1 chemotaxis protein CheA [Paenibacillus baekrokdamisoli]